MKRKKIFRIALWSAVAVLLVWTLWANSALELNEITVCDDEIPEAFDGFRIAHVSDLHNAEMGRDNEKLLALLRQAQPDIIAITGDLVDSRSTDVTVALDFVKKTVEIAPCYYITGNHEARLSHELYQQLTDGLTAAGVTVLSDEAVLLTREGETISVVGHAWGTASRLERISDFQGYTVLLSHAPEDVALYAAAGFDLVFSGHAHGGQFRLPLVGGLFAPGQGFFPAYDAGLYTVENTNMIVSRGIGNSLFPLRFNNRPEVVLAVLDRP